MKILSKFKAFFRLQQIKNQRRIRLSVENMHISCQKAKSKKAKNKIISTFAYNNF